MIIIPKQKLVFSNGPTLCKIKNDPKLEMHLITLPEPEDTLIIFWNAH